MKNIIAYDDGMQNDLKNEGNESSEKYLVNLIEKKKINWSKEEDRQLQQLVNEFGFNAWRLIKNLFNKKFSQSKRSAKNLRDRCNLLSNKSCNNSPWTPEEERILFENQYIHGNKWSHFSKLLNGRSNDNIKNHFYSKYRKRLRKILKYIKKNIEKINFPANVKEHLMEMDFKSLYENLQNKKIQYQELTILNIFKILFNLDEKKDISILILLEEFSKGYINIEISSQEDFFINNNKKRNFIEDSNLNERYEKLKITENKVSESTISSNKLTSSVTMDIDSDKTISDDSN